MRLGDTYKITKQHEAGKTLEQITASFNGVYSEKDIKPHIPAKTKTKTKAKTKAK